LSNSFATFNRAQIGQKAIYFGPTYLLIGCIRKTFSKIRESNDLQHALTYWYSPISGMFEYSMV